jgi:hypothetical protein
VKITPSQGQRLIALVNARAPKLTGPCPVCAAQLWSFNDTIFSLNEMSGTPGPTPDPSVEFPVWPVMCGNCGFTYFLNALTLGIVTKDGKLNIGD